MFYVVSVLLPPQVPKCISFYRLVPFVFRMSDVADYWHVVGWKPRSDLSGPCFGLCPRKYPKAAQTVIAIPIPCKQLLGARYLIACTPILDTTRGSKQLQCRNLHGHPSYSLEGYLDPERPPLSSRLQLSETCWWNDLVHPYRNKSTIKFCHLLYPMIS